MVQEKQGSDQGTKYSSARHTRLVLLYEILSIFLLSVYGLFMETTSIILAKPTIQCSETPIHHFHSLNVWNNILGSWLQKVSSTSSLRHNILHIMWEMGALNLLGLNLTNTFLIMQEKPTRCIQCHGFHVRRCSLHWSTKCLISAASCGCREDSLL